MAPTLSWSVRIGAKGRQSNDAGASKIVAALSAMANDYWMGEKSAESYFNTHIDEIFSIRIQSINWQRKNSETPINDWDALILHQDTITPSKALLVDNLLFAMRVAQRALRDMAAGSSNPVPGPSPQAPENLPEIDFQQFIGFVYLSTPDSLVQPIVDLFTASLRIEFAINVAYVLEAEHLTPENTQLEDLATFVAEAGQEFGAVARELQAKRPSRRINGDQPSTDVLEENQLLAELDLQTLSDL